MRSSALRRRLAVGFVPHMLPQFRRQQDIATRSPDLVPQPIEERLARDVTGPLWLAIFHHIAPPLGELSDYLAPFRACYPGAGRTRRLPARAPQRLAPLNSRAAWPGGRRRRARARLGRCRRAPWRHSPAAAGRGWRRSGRDAARAGQSPRATCRPAGVAAFASINSNVRVPRP